MFMVKGGNQLKEGAESRREFFDMVRRAELMDKSTAYEGRMCAVLDSLGVAYVRQHPIRTGRRVYFADIYIPTERLVIEMDGAYHFTEEQRRLDSNRSANMRRRGYRIIRFANGDLRRMGAVVGKLKKFIKNI